MHPLFSDTRHLFWYIAVWIVIGNAIASMLVTGGTVPVQNAVFFCVPVCILYGFLALSAYYVCRALPLAKRRLLRLVASYGITSLMSGLLLLFICKAWSGIGTLIDTSWSTLDLADKSRATVFGLGAGFYLLSILIHDVFIATENLRNAEVREGQSRIQAREAELQLLRMQINPHFLFNSLNSISALTSIDAAAARAMTIALAHFFRQTLALAEREKITLKDELVLCDSFLAVEKIRFGKKLASRTTCDEAAIHGLIPPMILQPLLENAIKHGIRTLADGGLIEVRAALRDKWLHIEVENPMEADAGAPQGNGIGLENIRRRCATLYDGRARVEWHRPAPARFLVILTLPYEAEEEAVSEINGAKAAKP